ncbi:thiamine pyrophosphate-dependent enzyme [Clostridiaceae bacterium OttesenSCG-928-D20]|nr:thiamine pyrophosphate-dependent enzyme [Clostridiaceae bacterium OttesenSCG-928-D20]
MNITAVDAGLEKLNEIKVPASWAGESGGYGIGTHKTDRADLEKYVNEILVPVNGMRGDELPVSVFTDTQNGTLPAGTAAFEKRGIAVETPSWVPENCIQCNQCSFVCPHACIRPFVMTEDELKNAPESTKSVKMTGKGCEGLNYSIITSVLDCTGCGSCANVCPAKNKALVMEPIETMVDEQKSYDYAFASVSEKELPFAESTVKGSQFKQPLVEFSGACAGCGETPYAKLVTQLYGDRMYLANATGCSSIWGGSAPSTPYTVNKCGEGPAWSNSLFEDNAEFGLGMLHAVKQRREGLKQSVEKLVTIDYCDEELAEIAKEWLASSEDAKLAKLNGAKMVARCKELLNRDFTGTPYYDDWMKNGKKCPCEACGIAREIVANADVAVKPSFWIFGGDGWAYDIGYGGLDHVLASGENVNILVFDTEVYSNTGGQASKATPTGAVAQFAAAGKTVKKKDLAQIAMSYGYIYVAQVSMGANYQQTLKAIQEAESYDGPSIIIAYAPCINHGNKRAWASLWK